MSKRKAPLIASFVSAAALMLSSFSASAADMKIPGGTDSGLGGVYSGIPTQASLRSITAIPPRRRMPGLLATAV